MPDTISAQNIYFPDVNFKNKLLAASSENQTARNLINQATIVDTNSNGEISLAEAANIGGLNLYNSNISDLTGINYFTNLISLAIPVNNIIALDISSLTKLTGFNCDTNSLNSLDLTGLSLLETVNIRSNQFNSFLTSNLPNLKYFACKYNQITTLDFSNNPQLKELVCSYNNLTSLNVKNGSTELIGSASVWNDCWTQGNPNLTTICADNNEIVPLQSFLASCNSGAQPNINSNCGLNNEQFSSNEFVIYPNPASATININGNDNFNFKLELSDLQGRVLQSKIVTNSQTSLDISGFENGVYFVKINFENRTQIERIIKE